MINFNNIPETVMHEFLGGRGDTLARISDDGKNKIMKITLAPGCSIGLHRHETSSEIILVLEGEGRAILDGKEETVRVGECHYCPRGSEHTFINEGETDLIFFAVVPVQ